jgi:hypothetical protein
VDPRPGLDAVVKKKKKKKERTKESKKERIPSLALPLRIKSQSPSS